MNKPSLALAAVLLAGCASSAEVAGSESGDGAMTLHVDAARVANCKANGGCWLFSRTELLEMVKQAAEAGARQTCPAKNKVLL